MPNIAVVGSINADLTVQVDRHPKPGETLLGAGGGVAPGGKGANQAVAAALRGADVHVVGAVGDDSYADPALALLKAAGVHLEEVETVPGSTGLAVITVAADGENSIVVVPGANASVDATFVQRHARTIREADVLLLQGEIPASGIEAAVALSQGRVIINLAPVVKVAPETLLHADPIMANEHEAGLILEQLGRTGDGSPEALARELLRAGFPSAVLTLGAKGALVADQSGLELVQSPRVKAVDTTGAGDAFAGAFCAAVLGGAGLREAAQESVRVAAFSVTGYGAQTSYPQPDQELPQ
ncbi:ribokinase [Corynebacterium gerontici]|uniref:Ribokinase n=1 Tax=Corynebacterium gerontici TaxID=2079234 RepID=A0A3G6IYI2_9CORY|nr:ribokinase [Corynebacterium gerontici]AZA10839.1 Ribokinase [Corynebacterium gerontici]